ncbi:MAG TPA: aspartate-semialdehyde dehydrogenase [Chlamydiales bacterium]|nr:aspartate-semialdehyde dehydrogenase [Chlamydiales bacterium]
MKKKTISIVGATGAVGQQIIHLLAERKFPIQQLRCFASPQSQGQPISFQGEKIPLEILRPNCFADTDLAFFCAGSTISKEWIPQTHCFVVDSSSAFRMQVPLIIPEINAHLLTPQTRIAASPNCAATVLLLPLFSLHRKFGAKRIIASTYQAASGGGLRLLKQLQQETHAALHNQPIDSPLPYAFNLYPHNSPLHASGYVEEELKIRDETRKILEDDQIQLSATCIRVPVLRAHSLSANVEFRHPFTLDAIYETLSHVPGLKIFEDRAQNRFPTPLDVTGKNDIYCGRFRIDPTQPNTLEFWAVGDQLLKGAALNAVQIAEVMQKELAIRSGALLG